MSKKKKEIEKNQYKNKITNFVKLRHPTERAHREKNIDFPTC